SLPGGRPPRQSGQRLDDRGAVVPGQARRRRRHLAQRVGNSLRVRGPRKRLPPSGRHRRAAFAGPLAFHRLPARERAASRDADLGEGSVSGFEVRLATGEDAPGIRRLFRKVFEKEMPAEEWEWKFARNPDGWFGTVAVADGEIVGNYAGWAMRVLLDGRERIAYSVGDVATDPAVRGRGGRRGVYRSMVELFYETLGERGVPFCFGFPNARAHEISNRVAGTRTLFPVRERHVPCGSFSAPPPGFSAADFVGESFDPLSASASRFLGDAAVRDRARANWRFHARPTRYYRMVRREGAGRMTAWAAISVQGEQALVA